MIIDHKQWEESSGVQYVYFTEPGRDGTIHTWEVSEEFGGASLSAQELRSPRLEDHDWKGAVSLLLGAVWGLGVKTAFELNRVSLHRPLRSGFCPFVTHRDCDYRPLAAHEAEQVWTTVGDRFRPQDSDVLRILRDLNRERASL